MKQNLELLADKLGQGHFDFLDQSPDEPQPEVFIFKSGAKLGRLSSSRWYAHSVTHTCDTQSALQELKAANFMRQARDLLHSAQSLRRVPMNLRVTYGGFRTL